MKNYAFRLVTMLIILVINGQQVTAQNKTLIKQDPIAGTIIITDGTGKLTFRLNYSGGCVIDQLIVNGKNTIAPSGVFSSIKPSAKVFSSKIINGEPEVKVSDSKVTVSNISFGEPSFLVTEDWTLTPKIDGISWEIVRKYSNGGKIDEMTMPVWNFANLSVWKGGILNNGGMVWCKYLTNKFDVLGMHTNGATFWNPQTGDGLRISSRAEGDQFIASKFFHGSEDEFSFAQYLSNDELLPRYHLNRFVNGKEDVFAPFEVKKETVKITADIQYINYDKEYPMGKLPGIDAAAVRELRNTTARYGVIDQNIMGANGWITNWKCLHEPFFAQIGLFVNDDNYTRNFSATLNQERDLAMTQEGRVLSRWHNEQGDEMPGTYNLKTGYYETQWGYTIDSQTSYIINTAEQFDLNGDLLWLRDHKKSCEKALNWLIKRDSNKNSLFEMMNDSYLEKKCSDWIDVVYASFENAFVNAQMYEALKQWAECERILGDAQNATLYSGIAAKLKESFNKTVADGGFWSPEKKCYVYWRDKDGTTHGDNIVTPVSFMAIAFGICDDPNRIKIILDNIELRMVAENLFHWPLCFDSFKKEEVEKVNWPFPNYENGDIFTSWGYTGVSSYVKYDKNIALKYIKKLLEQYNKDGLSSQRFSRKTQTGIGSDILSGNCTTITALFKDIYGIRPHWNRMGLEPNLSKELNGTEFEYTLRGTKYTISLKMNDYQLKTDQFTAKSNQGFGVNIVDHRLLFYPGNRDLASLILECTPGKIPDLEVKGWNNEAPAWSVGSGDTYNFSVNGLLPHQTYRLQVNEKSKNSYLANDSGEVNFSLNCVGKTTFKLTKVSR
jgi:hypothetical protein